MLLQLDSHLCGCARNTVKQRGRETAQERLQGARTSKVLSPKKWMSLNPSASTNCKQYVLSQPYNKGNMSAHAQARAPRTVGQQVLHLSTLLLDVSHVPETLWEQIWAGH